MKEQLIVWMPIIQQAVEILIPIVGMIVAWAARKWFVAKKSGAERARIVSIAETAYWVVVQYSRKHPSEKINKILKAIETAIAELKRPLSPGEQATVENTVKALHEQVRTGVGLAVPK